jgi:hypothetical protein
LAINITVLRLTEGEASVTIEVLEEAYRAMHREVWDLEKTGNPRYLPEARARLATLDSVLTKSGSSGETALCSTGRPRGP